jgi:hypothetical protein
MESKMAIIVKSSIKITKGFDTWQKMVKSQDKKLKEQMHVQSFCVDIGEYKGRDGR